MYWHLGDLGNPRSCLLVFSPKSIRTMEASSLTSPALIVRLLLIWARIRPAFLSFVVSSHCWVILHSHWVTSPCFSGHLALQPWPPWVGVKATGFESPNEILHLLYLAIISDCSNHPEFCSLPREMDGNSFYWTLSSGSAHVVGVLHWRMQAPWGEALAILSTRFSAWHTGGT